jgi:hypothetical protein
VFNLDLTANLGNFVHFQTGVRFRLNSPKTFQHRRSLQITVSRLNQASRTALHTLCALADHIDRRAPIFVLICLSMLRYSNEVHLFPIDRFKQNEENFPPRQIGDRLMATSESTELSNTIADITMQLSTRPCSNRRSPVFALLSGFLSRPIVA